MEWIVTPESSSIAVVAYEPECSTLIIKFKNGGSYGYFGVPRDVFDAMIAAPSKGRYFAEHIKGMFHHARLYDRQRPSVVSDVW